MEAANWDNVFGSWAADLRPVMGPRQARMYAELAPADLMSFLQHGLSARSCAVVELEECFNETCSAACDAGMRANAILAMLDQLAADIKQRLDYDELDAKAVREFWTKNFCDRVL